MRTTLAIDDDILAAARHLAERDSKSVGEVISSLARQGLARGSRAARTERNGVPLLPSNKIPLSDAQTTAIVAMRFGSEHQGVVGLRPVNPAEPLTAGSHFINRNDVANAANDQGYMTSVCYSPHVGSSIALGLLKNGANRKGEVLRAVNPLKDKEVLVEVVSAHFVDPEGERLRG